MFQKTDLGARFWRLWIATGVSSLGDGLVLVAFPLLALSFTRNPILIAGVVAVDRLPALLFGLWVGAWADRANRRRMLLTIELLRMLAVSAFAALVIFGADDLAAIYGAVFILGGLTMAYDVTASAVLPDLVGADQLVPANSQIQAVEMTGEEMAGQALGGVALAAARAVPFIADAVSFAVSAAMIPGAIPDKQPDPAITTLWADLREGLKWFLGDPTMRLMAGLISSLAFCQAAVLGLLVLYGTQVLHLSRSGYGLLLGVTSLGSLAGAVMAPRIHSRLGNAASIVLVGVVAAVAYVLLGATTSPYPAAVILVAESGAVMLGNVIASVVRQTSTPKELLGRVTSAVRVCILGSLPLGAFAGGLAAEHIGVRHTMLVAGILQMDFLVLLAPRLVVRLRPSEPTEAPAAPSEPVAP